MWETDVQVFRFIETENGVQADIFWKLQQIILCE